MANPVFFIFVKYFFCPGEGGGVDTQAWTFARTNVSSFFLKHFFSLVWGGEGGFTQAWTFARVNVSSFFLKHFFSLIRISI